MSPRNCGVCGQKGQSLCLLKRTSHAVYDTRVKYIESLTATGLGWRMSCADHINGLDSIPEVPRETVVHVYQ
ncbi:hypothetical protein PLUA15_20136 [Pseudomonas lundensis]|uniref:Uncharacterized protein n=1 Tax=Pseudomonas lundensis TaxID=86185 RepID=A0AAX2H6B1_9PSED|nr:hypothetical protein PLUA15_20136 [Pseudomonas lundensis]